MANQFVNLPAPAGNGSGAAVDVSTFGALKSIVCSGDADAVVTVEFNNAAVATDGSWQAITSFQPRGEANAEVAVRWMRARVSGYNSYAGGQPQVDIGGTDDGSLFVNLPVPAANGVGAAVDVSSLGTFKTVQVGGAYRGTTIIEVSQDGTTDWSQPFSFSNAPAASTQDIAAKWMRVRRTGVPTISPGLPVVNVGAVVPGSGGGGGGGALTDITPAALPAGTTDDYNPAGLATAGRVRQAVNVDSSSLSGLEAQTNGLVKYLQNLGPAALTLLPDDVGSVAANRFTLPDDQPVIVPPGGTAGLVYDSATSRWQVLSIAKAVPSYNVRDYGAVGDGVADDLVPFTQMVTEAVAAGPGAKLVIPPGTYRLSQYLDIAYARQMEICGSGGATIVYPSDDTAIVPDPIADLIGKARSAFLLRYSSDVSIEGLTFKGGTAQQITDVNVGCGIYATHAVNTIVSSCNGIQGYALFVQDATADSTGTGTSIAVALGIVTLTDVTAPFNPGFGGRNLTLAGCTNAVNDGAFANITYVSPTQISFPNAGATAEVSAFSWTVDNGDRLTMIENCSSYGCRGPMRTGSDGIITASSFEQPMNLDATGQGDSFTVVGATVTLHDAAALFLPYHDKKYIKILDATSPANDVFAQITYLSSTTVSFNNPAGVQELFDGKWWIMGGDKTGIGAGVGAFTVALGITTFTASAPIFQAADLEKVIRFRYATSDVNNGNYVISEVVSSTQVRFANPFGVAEAFSQGFSVDAYDNRREGGNTYGSSHAIYLFAGRSNVMVDGCTFKGIRTVALKVSGSIAPIRNIAMRGCYVFECGAAFIGGADDAQEHTGFEIEGNQIVNTAIGREGWTESTAIQILGAKNVAIRDNKFHYMRNALRSVDGSASLAGVYAIQGARYVQGRSQPLTDIMIDGNMFTADANRTTPNAILASTIQFEQVGVTEIYGADAAVSAKVGNICTLTSAIGLFSQAQVGCNLTLVFSAGGNDVGPVPVLSVAAGGGSLTYENAGGAAGFSAGTFRITAPGGRRGGVCDVMNNDILNVCSNGILSQKSVAVTVVDNTFSGCEVLAQFDGDVTPRIANNRQIGRTSDTAGIRLNNSDGADDARSVSWPFIDGNLITNDAIGTARPWGIGVGVSGGVYVDFPLLGKRGRALPSGGKEQVVVSYGSGLVDGDQITVDDGTNPAVTYTYKAAAPGALQFNSFAGLVALITAQPNIDCSDYGAGFLDSTGAAAPIVTQHLLISAAAATANTDGTLKVQCDALLQTALVLLPNTISPNRICGGRGSGSGGPTADKVVIWSPYCSFEGCEVLVADNAAAQALMVTGSFRSIRNPAGQDGGSNTLLQVGTTAGTEQYRWVIG